MKKLICYSVLVFCVMKSTAQVAINNTGALPDPNAMLDIKSPTKGLLIPRTSTVTRLTLNGPIGLMMYDTVTKSFWIHNGTSWNEVTTATTVWGINGNANTSPAFNYIGTSDNQPLRFRVNNTWAGNYDINNRNYFIGAMAGFTETTGKGNIAIGTGALTNSLNGSNSIAIGDSALYSDPRSLNNIAIGDDALKSVQNFGYNNTAIGSSALRTNGNGHSNIGVGYNSLYYNNDGESNVGVGNFSLLNNSSGISNVGLGYYAGKTNTIGFSNTFIGAYSDGVGVVTNATAIGAEATVSCSNCLVLGGSGAINKSYVGIGKADPFYTLDINQINGRGIGLRSSGDGNYSIAWEISHAPNPYPAHPAQAADLVLSYNNTLVGAFANTTGVYSSLSDSRMKKDILSMEPVLGKIMQLEPRTYSFKNDSSKGIHYGFISQEIEKIFPQLIRIVSTEGRNPEMKEVLMLDYSAFGVLAIKAIQEQQKMIEEMRKEIELLKKAKVK